MAAALASTAHACLQSAGDPRGAHSVVADAERLRRDQRLKEAAALLARFSAEHAPDYDILVELARVHREARDLEVARDELVRALQIRPNGSEANLDLGEMLADGGRYPEAMDRFETVLVAEPHNARAHDGELRAVTGLATTMRQQGHSDLALLALEHAREKLPDDPQLLLKFGIQATEMRRLPEALTALERAHDLEPGDTVILYALAHAQFDAQHVADAEASLRQYLKDKPDDASAHFALGRALEVQARFEEARVEFQDSIRLQPVQTESYYELGDMEVNRSNDAAAEPLLAHVLARDPHHGGALTDMGRICLRRKEYPAAVEWLVKAVTAAPGYPQAHYQYGLALSHLGRKAQAETEVRAAADLGRTQNAAPP